MPRRLYPSDRQRPIQGRATLPPFRVEPWTFSSPPSASPRPLGRLSREDIWSCVASKRTVRRSVGDVACTKLCPRERHRRHLARRCFASGPVWCGAAPVVCGETSGMRPFEQWHELTFVHTKRAGVSTNRRSVLRPTCRRTRSSVPCQNRMKAPVEQPQNHPQSSPTRPDGWRRPNELGLAKGPKDCEVRNRTLQTWDSSALSANETSGSGSWFGDDRESVERQWLRADRSLSPRTAVGGHGHSAA